MEAFTGQRDCKMILELGICMEACNAIIVRHSRGIQTQSLDGVGQGNMKGLRQLEAIRKTQENINCLRALNGLLSELSMT